MAEPFDERMGDTDALMWRIEKDPVLRSTITSLLVFESPPDPARLMEKLERATRSFSRLRQRVMANPFSIAPPRWEIDPSFDLRFHLRRVGAPGGGKRDEVVSMTAVEAMSGFDLARPLWQMIVIDKMADGKSAVIVKLHHTITDGIGAVRLGLELFELEANPGGDAGPMPELPAGHVKNQFERVLDAWEHEQRQALALAARFVPAAAGSLAELVLQPRQVLHRAADLAGSLGRLLAPAFAPMSPIMTGRSPSVELGVLSVPLADAKAAAKAAGGRLNDFFVAGVLGGLRRYHRQHGSAPEWLRMGMPISVRPPSPAGSEAAPGGNRFVPTRFLAPLQIDDPAARIRAVRDLVASQRAEPALDVVGTASLVARRLPRMAQIGVLGGLTRTVDVATSNVPGVAFPLYLAGARLEEQYPFGPRGGTAVNVTTLSYRDRLFIGVNTDPAAVPDHRTFMQCVEDGFDDVLDVA